MATLNKARRGTGPRTHEGGVAVPSTAEQELRRAVMACLLWEDTFYESGVDIAKRIGDLVRKVPLDVSAKIADDARNRMYIRHASLLVAREMAREGGLSVIGDTIDNVVQRADELAEFLAIYWKDGKKTPLSAQVKKGLAKAFTKFDAYQLAKYDRAKSVRLRDVLFLVHPKPKDEEQQALWNALAEGKLTPPDTWEVGLSSGEDKKEVFSRLIEEGKLGGLALLRNLRNMEQAGVDRKLIKFAIEENSFKRVLPFRFISAAEHAPDMEPELERAMFRACESLPKLGGKTALVIDTSGSMGAALSQRSTMSRKMAAAALGMLVRELCDDIDVISFGTYAELLPPRRGFALGDVVRRSDVGYGTMVSEGMKIADKRGYDRAIVVTDMQVHDGLHAPKGKGYIINTAPYRNAIGYGAWTIIDGWSENVVRYISEKEG